MAQKSDRRLLITEAQIRSQISPCESCGGEGDTGLGFSQSTPVFPVSIIPYQLHTRPLLHVARKRRTNGFGLGTFQTGMLFENQRTIDRSVLAHNV